MVINLALLHIYIFINKIIQRMDHIDIETSLKKVNRRFTQEMSEEDRKRAFKEFKKVYAEEMAKIVLEINKRKKVQENLTQINQQEMKEAKQIDDQLKKKMNLHDKKRQMEQENKVKNYKLMDQNWKRKMDEILRKNKQRDRQSHKKSQKMRKQLQQYWNKKNSLSKDHLQDQKSSVRGQTLGVVLSENKTLMKRDHSSDFQLYSYKFQQPKLPNLKKSKLGTFEKSESKTLNISFNDQRKDQKIRAHIEKSKDKHLEKQQQNFQKVMTKLQKIEKTRSNVQKRIQKEVSQSKRIRELKLNPETLASNRKRSIQQQKSKSKSNIKHQRSIDQLKNSESKEKINLDHSISKRLKNKRKIEEMEFKQRENMFQSAMSRIKRGKMNKIIRDAVQLLKYQTLKETD